ncbi:DUF7311 family protein [Haloglomus halophilum]|uniref:DUF7311 family protein n=1 Tax=Haloglomus halophilum TaxID=2962672 RepID=UPI0020C9A464|nr:hypothetical protein [Haloglomus halophilum]
MSGPLRTTLAVLLAGALLAAGLAAADQARETRTATRLDETVTRFVDAADRLAARNDPTRSGIARRTMTVTVPAGGTVGIERGVVRWRVDGGPWHRRQPSVALDTGETPLELAAGHHQLRLSLRLRAGSSVVSVSRFPEVETGSRDHRAHVRRT